MALGAAHTGPGCAACSPELTHTHPKGAVGKTLLERQGLDRARGPDYSAPAEINGAVVLSWSRSIPCSSRAGAEHPLQPPSQLVLGTASLIPHPSSSAALQERCETGAGRETRRGGKTLLHHTPGRAGGMGSDGFFCARSKPLAAFGPRESAPSSPARAASLPVISERERGEMLRRREKPAGHRRAGLTIRSVYF